MISLNIIIFILISHYVADFICQTQFDAENKSRNNKCLFDHVITYNTIFFIIIKLLDFSWDSKWVSYIVINSTIHYFTDYITSRLSSKLWNDKKIKMFFNTIGFDQTCHYIFLFATYVLMYN